MIANLVFAVRTPHPAFGHLLPQGEKAMWRDLAQLDRTDIQDLSPSPLVGDFGAPGNRSSGAISAVKARRGGPRRADEGSRSHGA